MQKREIRMLCKVIQKGVNFISHVNTFSLNLLRQSNGCLERKGPQIENPIY